MVGIDTDVLKAQVEVLREAQELHRLALQEAIDLEASALATEARAHTEAARAQQIQRDQRAGIRACAADINEITEALRTIPPQRRPASGP